MKNHFIVLSLLLLIFALISPTYAQNRQIHAVYIIVAGDGVTLKDGPGINYQDGGRIEYGEKVIVKSIVGEWFKIQYKEKTGFIFADNAEIDNVATEKFRKEVVPASEHKKGKHKKNRK